MDDFSSALFTDFYQLTMAYGYWKQKKADTEATFQLFFRRAPFQGGFTLAAGLAPFLDWLQQVRFSRSDLDYLAQLRTPENQPYFCEEFLRFLEEMKWTLDIDAVPEGSVVFPFEAELLFLASVLIQERKAQQITAGRLC